MVLGVRCPTLYTPPSYLHSTLWAVIQHVINIMCWLIFDMIDIDLSAILTVLLQL